jgi:hypothetical protein
MKETFVILPVRNRREITLRCLRHSCDLDSSWLRGGMPLGVLWSPFAYRGSGLYWRASQIYSPGHWGLFAGAIISARPTSRWRFVNTDTRAGSPRSVPAEEEGFDDD